MLPLIAALAKAGLGLIGNAVVATGKEVVERTLGVDLERALGTEDGRIKLQQLQYEHEEKLREFDLAMRDQDLKAAELVVADAASARDMNVRLNESPNASWLAKNVASILALFVVVVGMVLLFATKEADVRTAVVGLITMVLGFYFGTSMGSRDNQEALRKALERSP